MATAGQVFLAAMALMDEPCDEVGSPDTAEYRERAPGIINILQGELYPLSDGYPRTAGRAYPGSIGAITDTLTVDDYLALTVLPYGLASALLLDENPTAADYFRQRYEELRAAAGRGMAAVSGDIEDLYDVRGGRYNNMAGWGGWQR